MRTRRLEEVERDLEALSLLADQAVGRNARFVEDERACVGGAEPELALLAAGLHARVLPFDEEGADRAVELREHHGHVGDAAVRDVDLLPAQGVRVSVAARLSTDRCEIGSGVRLRERDRRKRSVFAREQREITVPLRVCAEPQQRPHGKHRRLDRSGQRRASPRELLRDQRARDRIRASASVLRRNRVRREPHPGGFRK